MFNEVIVAKKNIFPMMQKGNTFELRNEWFNKIWSNETYEVYLITSSQGLTQVNKKIHKEIVDKSLRRILIKSVSDYYINIPRYIVVEKNDSLFIQDKKIIASNFFYNDNIYLLDGTEDCPYELQILSKLISNIKEDEDRFHFFVNNLVLSFFHNWSEGENVDVYNYLLDNKIVSYDGILSTNKKRFPARIRNLFKRRFLNDPYPFLKAINTIVDDCDTKKSLESFYYYLNLFSIDLNTIKIVLEKDIHIKELLPINLINKIMDRDFYYKNKDIHPEIAVHYVHKLTEISELYKLIDANPNNIRFIPDIQEYKELWIHAVKLNPDCLIYADNRMLNYIAEKIDINDSNIKYLFKYIRNDKKTKEHILYMIRNHKIDWYLIPENLLDNEIKEEIIKNVRNNSLLALKCIENNPSLIELFVEKIHKDHTILHDFDPCSSDLINNIFKHFNLDTKKQLMILCCHLIPYIDTENMTLELYQLARSLGVKRHSVKFGSKSKTQLFEEELFLWNQSDMIKTRIEKIPEIIENIMRIDRTVKQLKEKK